jgi:hypothetical protein
VVPRAICRGLSLKKIAWDAIAVVERPAWDRVIGQEKYFSGSSFPES